MTQEEQVISALPLHRFCSRLLLSNHCEADTLTNRAARRWAWSLGRRGLTTSPSTIGGIARPALVLTHFEHSYIT
jgi:hypothetical protein